MWGRRAAWRVAVSLWLLFGVIVWNGVFDYRIRMAARTYVDAQQDFLQGRGPHVLVGEVMWPAATAAARSATACGLLAAAPGLATLAWLAWRVPRSPDPARP